MTGLPDDPSDRPARMAHYGVDSAQQQLLANESETTAAELDVAPDPWYRNRVLLAMWALMVALVLTLIVYGIIELSRGGGGTGVPAPHTSTSTPQRSSSTSTSPMTTTEAPPTQTSEQTSEGAPPPASNPPAPAEPPPHHHHWHLPHIF